MPEISIIVPVYKVEQYLDRCVTSILNQTFKDFELILVDDGSPDNCPQMCDKWAKKDKRISVIHKENGGLSSARNEGLKFAKSEFINFVDSDDWLEQDALQYLYGLIKKFDADFSMASYDRKKNNCKRVEESCLSQREFLKKFFKIGTQEDVQFAWAKLYKRYLFDTVNYPLGLTAEDIPATFQIALKCEKIAVSNKIIYHYFFNPNSITSSEFGDRTFDLIKVWDLVCEYANDSTEEIQNWAKFNRNRIDFGILFHLAIDGNYRYCSKKYEKEIQQLHASLRNHVNEFMKAPIPISRKILIFAFSYMMKPSMYVINTIFLLRK